MSASKYYFSSDTDIFLLSNKDLLSCVQDEIVDNALVNSMFNTDPITTIALLGSIEPASDNVIQFLRKMDLSSFSNPSHESYDDHVDRLDVLLSKLFCAQLSAQPLYAITMNVIEVFGKDRHSSFFPPCLKQDNLPYEAYLALDVAGILKIDYPTLGIALHGKNFPSDILDVKIQEICRSILFHNHKEFSYRTLETLDALTTSPSLKAKHFETIIDMMKKLREEIALNRKYTLGNQNAQMKKWWQNILTNPSISYDAIQDAFLYSHLDCTDQYLSKSITIEAIASSKLSILDAIDLISHESLFDEGEHLISTAGISNCLQGISLRNDVELLPEMMRKKDSMSEFYYNGYNLSELARETKITQFSKLLIGTSHKQEVTFLTNSLTQHGKTFFQSISIMQSLFTSNNKMDRHSYLEFLAWVNENKVNSKSFDIEVKSIISSINAIGFDGVKSVLTSNKDGYGARDTFNYLDTLINTDIDSQEIKDKHAEKQITLINRWLANNNQNYNCLFHDYLMNKAKREEGREIIPVPFKQSLPEIADQIDAINSELAQIKENQYSIFLPKNSFELARIGSAQRHCVGGSYYAEGCKSGGYCIFSVNVNNAIKHGFTFQFRVTDGQLIQAEGFCRSMPPKEATELAAKVFLQINPILLAA